MGTQTPDTVPDVVICETHHSAFSYWLEAFRAQTGRCKTPYSLVHVDAHPDLSPPRRTPAFLTEAMGEDYVDPFFTDSFVLGALWLGVIRDILWVRPSWARQLPDGSHRFHLRLVGKRFAVDGKFPYYVLFNRSTSTEDLEDKRFINLRVSQLEEAAEVLKSTPSPVIWDIDLDYFASRNPVVAFLEGSGFSEPEILELRSLLDIHTLIRTESPYEMRQQMQRLDKALRKLIFGEVEERPSAGIILKQAGVSADAQARIRALILKPDEFVRGEEFLQVWKNLSFFPHHSVDIQEIKREVDLLMKALKRSSPPPALITISQSVRDGYTPEKAARLALNHIVGRVKERWPGASIRRDTPKD